MSDHPQTYNVRTARQVAINAIHAVLQDGVQLEAALDRQNGFHELAGRDRAFARLLVSTLFRRLGQIDKVLTPYLTRNPPFFVRSVLRLGAVQILVLKTPVHAAVDESVNLVKSKKKYNAFAGLVNAVLRKVAGEGKAAFGMTTPQDNLPKWIARSWEKAYGRSDMRRMARQLSAVPPLDLSVKSNPREWAERLGGQVIFDHTVRLQNASHVPDLDGYKDGEWWVQDASAAIPASLLGDLEGKKVLDMCAAPGGKTLQLVAAGASVTALDKSEPRLKRVRENLDRTGFEADIHCADALEWGDPDHSFDHVLLDAPCSATGTFRRHPDVLSSKTPNVLGPLGRLQDRLLERALKWVGPGGTLLYCTCSLQFEEGEGRVKKLLAKHENLRLEPIIPADIPGMPAEAFKDGMLQILPHFLASDGGVDGFFTAKINCIAPDL